MDETELLEFISSYYRSPAPERAAEAVARYANSPMVEDPASRVPAAYFFARLASEHPVLIPEYEAVLRDSPPAGRRFIREILDYLAINPSGPVNALDRIVRTSTDNDLLWAEFSLTGSPAPISRLIDILEWSDTVRDKLQCWLQSPPSWLARLLAAGWRRELTRSKLILVAGIRCDLERKHIVTADDLDCISMTQGLDFVLRDRFAEIRRAFPFGLTAEEMGRIAIKATAKWSLAGYALRHPIVLDTCEREIPHRKGRARLSLLEIAVEARFRREDYGAAAKWLKEYLQMNPDHAGMQDKWLVARSEVELDGLLNGLAQTPVSRRFPLDQAADIARACAEKLQKATAFCSRVILRGPTAARMNQRGNVVMQWRLRFQAPDLYHVLQTASGEQSDDHDLWVSIGAVTYQNAGVWFQWPNRWQHARQNRILRGSQWLEPLLTGEPVSASLWEYPGRQCVILEYAADHVSALMRSEAFESEMQELPARARYWIDPSTCLLEKAELSLKDRTPDGKEHLFEYEQVFAAFDTGLQISAPRSPMLLRRQ
ncbi:MAG: hypothetical protein HY423_14930 [Candidatus Lambdaproteobacteria bacterium]|nr:hypothetical protein [Candidatus Lambdaproteobacteria bacterium]